MPIGHTAVTFRTVTGATTADPCANHLGGVAITAEARSAQPATPEPPSILSKAFELLRAFNSNERVMSLSELARAAQLPKSTVHRLLARLVELDAIESHAGGYRLSIGLLQLGAHTPAAAMRDLALPFLAALHRWTNCTVHLGVLRDFDVVYLEKLGRPGTVGLSSVGARLPANCTAIGKALLAGEDLDDLAAFMPSPLPMLTPHSISDVDKLIGQLRLIRNTGLAKEREESQPGLACLAAPIVVRGFTVAAVSVSFDPNSAPDFKVATALRDATAGIARDARDSLADPRHTLWFPHFAEEGIGHSRSEPVRH